ncbi:MAG: T9SS type A sorting domain-containing protein [Bacteroidia bacterium]|nr:T9SS type A sorting domain-containing protein [Bacteroidia bacterium]
MKKFCLFCLLLCFFLNVNAQIFSKEFGSASDTIDAKEILIAKDSGIAIFANSRSNSFDEIVFIKMNELGDTLFTKRYSSNKDLIIGNVEQSDVDSSFFVLAKKDSASCIINIDKVGNIIWQKNYQLQDSLLFFRKMKLVDNDSIFILGRIGHGYDGDFFLKMDRQGNVVDQIKFGRDSLHLTSNYPKIDNFIVDAANNVIFTGQEAETNWPLTNFSALLFKMNSNLELVWRYSNDLAYENFDEIVQNSNGEYWIFSHYFYQGSRGTSLVTVDTTGNYVCTRFFEIHAPGGIFIYNSIYTTPAGGVINGVRLGGKSFRIEMDNFGDLVNYKVGTVGQPTLTVETQFRNYSTVQGGQNKIIVYDTRYSNCFLEDSISSTNCAQWNFPQTSYLNLESVAHQFVIDTVSWNVSSGISISNGCISLGTNEMIKEDYKIYPNPSTGKVYFQYLGSTENLVFNLYDINSRLVYHGQDLSCNKELFNADYFHSGIYFYNFIAGDSVIYSGKIIIPE